MPIEGTAPKVINPQDVMLLTDVSQARSDLRTGSYVTLDVEMWRM